MYPEELLKAVAQGNVILIARIDKSGKVQDIEGGLDRPTRSSSSRPRPPSALGVPPALKDGKPIEIAANIVCRSGSRTTRGRPPAARSRARPISELAIYPADASGKKTRAGGLPDPTRRRPARCASRPRSTSRRSGAARKVDGARRGGLSPTGEASPVFEDTLSVAGQGHAASSSPSASRSAPTGRTASGCSGSRWTRQDAGTASSGSRATRTTFDFAAALKQEVKTSVSFRL